MLIEFRVENHRSLRDEQVLSMEAGRGGDDSDPRPRHVTGHPERLLPVAGLYGANASGKSNVLAALVAMRDAVLSSHRHWPANGGVPREPFAWGPKRVEPSSFEVTILLNEIRFQYGLRSSDEFVLEEWLHAWPFGKKQVWFERDTGNFKFGVNLKGENKLIEEVTRPNALFLSTAVQFNHVQLQPIFRWFQSLEAINVSAGGQFFNRQLNDQVLARLFEEPSADVDQRTLSESDEFTMPIVDHFLRLLKAADFGILNVRVARNESDETPRQKRAAPQFYLKHQSESKDAWLPLEEESHGTRTLFARALPILRRIQSGGVILVDELEANLHPSLARKIVDQFNSPASNPRNAQLIFATHDTNLLGTTVGEPALRRDQIWLTEKDDEGATVLYPLTDFKPRKAENIERGYLQGRYGAIPFLGDFPVAVD